MSLIIPEECYKEYGEDLDGCSRQEMGGCSGCNLATEDSPRVLDSGVRRAFPSGAVRDIAEGKGRCDLLPLGIITDRLNDRVFIFIEEYIRLGDPASLWFALDEFIGKDDKEWYSALLEVAKQYEDGAKKYGDRNWEKGIPLHCYIDSGVRHYLKWRRGDTDEPHDRAFVWNMLGAIWTHKNKPELIDLPFATKGESA
jgi:hypothetical protein